MVLDVSGLGRLLGVACGGAELARAAAGVPKACIAVARSQTAARLLASARPGLTVPPGDAAAALAPLPVDSLRTFMEDEDARGGTAAARVQATAVHLETFRRWGLTMLGEIAALPSIDLSERLGQVGLVLQQLARGVDRAPLVPDPGVPRFVQSMDLEGDRCARAVVFVFARLLDPLSAALERRSGSRAEARSATRRSNHSHAGVAAAAAPRSEGATPRCSISNRILRRARSTLSRSKSIRCRAGSCSFLLERALPSPETGDAHRALALVGERRCGSPVLLDTCASGWVRDETLRAFRSQPPAPASLRDAKAGSPKRRSREAD